MSKHILAIDDSVINIKLLKTILEQEGYEFTGVQDATQAVEKAREIKPQIILLDVMMPKIDGYTLLGQFSEDGDLKDTPVIMVTAKTNGEDLQRALGMGAFDYIKKPLDKLEVIARIASALKYYHQKELLKEMAIRDSLTKLYNHALIMDLLEKEIYHSDRESYSVGFLMMDLDHFKAVNDTHGHQAGDYILVETAKILEKAFRLGDSIGRYGGEEFAVILPRVNNETALMLGERLRKTIEEHDFDYEGTNIKLTASVGISLHTGSTEGGSMAQTVKQADVALYRAKTNGRNQTVILGEGDK